MASSVDTTAPLGAIRDRVLGFRRVRASSLVPHPKNPRQHSALQRQALREVLASIGFAGAELVRELPDGRLQLLDGHLRAEELGTQEIPVLVTDLSDAEADVLLASYDPIARLATFDADKTVDLLAALDGTEHGQVKALLEAVAAQDNPAWLFSRTESLPPMGPSRYQRADNPADGAGGGADNAENGETDDGDTDSAARGLPAVRATTAPESGGLRSAPELRPAVGGQVVARYGVLAECADEDAQRRAYDLLTREGFPCRVLTL